MWITSLFSLLLLFVALVLAGIHLRGWQSVQNTKVGKEEGDFLRRRFRRRIQVSGMVGFVGVAIFIGYWITAPLVWAVYWLAVMGVVLWIVLLAITDLVDTQIFYTNMRTKHAFDEHRLREAADLARSEAHNGRSKTDADETNEDKD